MERVQSAQQLIGNRAVEKLLSSSPETGTGGSTGGEKPLSPMVSYPPTPDAFQGIELYEEVGLTPLLGKTDFTPGGYRSTYFLLVPQLRRTDPVSVFAYIAYNTSTRRNEYVIGPGELGFFLEHEARFAGVEPAPPDELASAAPGVSYPPAPDAFPSIELFYVVGPTFLSDKAVVSAEPYKATHYWLYPQLRRTDPVTVYAYVAYSPLDERNELIIGPDFLPFFLEHEGLYFHIAQATYPMAGEPEQYEVEHARMVSAAFHGHLGYAVGHFGASWRAALGSRKWWTAALTSTAPLLKSPEPTTVNVTRPGAPGATTRTVPPEPGATSGTGPGQAPIVTGTRTPTPTTGQPLEATPLPVQGPTTATGGAGRSQPKAAKASSMDPRATLPSASEVTPPAAASKTPVAILPDGRELPPTSYAGGYTAPGEPITIEQALKDGLPARGGDWRLLEHAQPGSELARPELGGSAFRGTTPNPSSLGLSGQGAADWAGEGGLVFEVRNVPTWNLEQALEGQIRDPTGLFGRQLLHKAELEGAIPARVPPECIVRVGRVSLTPTGKAVVMPQDWVPNPGYKPPVKP